VFKQGVNHAVGVVRRNAEPGSELLDRFGLVNVDGAGALRVGDGGGAGPGAVAAPVRGMVVEGLRWTARACTFPVQMGYAA
jgi:hypothetical protein